MAIKAKYAGTCAATGKRYSAGAMIEKGEYGWQIAGAIAPDRTVREGEFQISGGEFYEDGYTPGQTFRYTDRRPAEITGQIVTVRTAWSTYYREDGMSFGVGDESGYVYSAIVRPATDEEASPVLEAEARREEKRKRDAELKRLFATQDGECVPAPETGLLQLDGIRVPVGKGFDIYGGGEELLVETGGEYVWRLVNNGMDGDDWRRNNVSTGGAGAIGYRFPATPERLALIRQMPGGESIEDRIAETPADRRTRVLAHLKSKALKNADESVLALFPGLPVDARTPPPAVWVEVGKVLIGMTLGGDRLYMKGPYPSSIRDDFYAAGFDCSDNVSAVYLHFEATPEAAATLRALWPGWVGTSEAGRFVVARVGRRHACDNAADALRAANLDGAPVNLPYSEESRTGVRFDPGITVEHLDKRLIAWSDGTVSTLAPLGLSFYSIRRMQRDQDDYVARERAKGRDLTMRDYDESYQAAGFPPVPPLPDGEVSMSPDASRLISVAAPQSEWREGRRFMRFENVDAITGRETLLDAKNGHSSSGTFSKLERLQLRYLDNREETVYLATSGWWAMGEDGDADETLHLYETERDARAWLDSQAV